jgi:hypothetical protein
MDERKFGYRSHDGKAAVSVVAGQSKTIVEENNKSGHLRYVAVNFDVAAYLRLKITLDGQVIFNRSPDEISQAAAAKLGLGNTAGAGGMLQSPAYASTAYNILLDFSADPLRFETSLKIEAVNSDTASAHNIDDDYILYDIN